MSAKVFLIVWGLTEHRGYMVLMSMKQNLLNTKAFDDIEVIHCIMQSRYISKRTRETVGPPDGISYANSHTLHPDFFILGRGALMILTSLDTSYKWHHNSICPLCKLYFYVKNPKTARFRDKPNAQVEVWSELVSCFKAQLQPQDPQLP